MVQTPFHQANLALKQDFEAMRNDVVASLNAMSEMHQNYPPGNAAPPAAAPTAPPPAEASMNAARDATTAALLEAVDKLTTKISELETRQTRGDRQPRNGQQQFRYRRNISKYCWSHGACNHAGRDCRSPRPGHKPEAMFTNCMDGSNDYCRLAMEQKNGNTTGGT